jgi:N-methylhydantoinase B
MASQDQIGDTKMTRTAELSPLTLEIVGAELNYVVREMRSTVIRMAYSPILTETHDFSCAITNKAGEIVAMNVDVPFHMFAVRYAVESVYEKYGEDEIRPGDQFFLNDPWQVGSHLNDTVLLTPYFFEGKLLLWLACMVHYGDVGGTVLGSASGECSEIFHEGIRFPVVRIRDKGELADDLIEVLLANVRQPFEVQGVFAAQSNTTILAQKRLTETCERYGASLVEACVERLLDNAEKQTRQSIGELKDGTYFFEDYLENGGVHRPTPVYFACAMTIDGGSIKFDFTGSDEQVAGVCNGTLVNTRAAVFDVVDTYMAPGNVSNSGAARAIEVVAPEGTVVNSRFPAPVNGYATVMFGPIHGCVIGCLAQVMPDEVSGLSTSSANQTNIGGVNTGFREKDVYWLVYEYPPGGWGATRDTDGSLLCYQWHIGDIPTIWPVERLESLNPIRAHFNDIYVDSGGPGERRGGPGIMRAWEVTKPAEFAVLGTDGVLPRAGLCGGYAGALNWISVIRDGKPVKTSEMPLKAGGFKLLEGDIIMYLVSGGGGYGDPLERQTDRVLKDLRDGYVSIDGAREDYGVVIVDGQVDEGATRTQRESMRGDRLFATIAATDEDGYDELRRRTIPLSPQLAGELKVADGDLVEFVRERGAHLRGWVRIDDQLSGNQVPLGPRAREICGVEDGGSVQIRQPWTYAMRRQREDLEIDLPLGQTFSSRALTKA